eukprot:TRINITY_DN7559_c0_g1_i1.p1 TRINITY_DN7559_c0_g1~~TRINITY_DN7559_c0_g1_i1.p1  ORF type:complete len:785 (-),score=110.90 TRINITY_DN7559_c0_g1_i1:64-2370(-)
MNADTSTRTCGVKKATRVPKGGTWIESALLKSTIKESQTLAKKEALPVLTLERRQSFKWSGCRSPRDVEIVKGVHHGARVSERQPTPEPSDNQSVDDFLTECRWEAALGVQLEFTGSFAGMGQAYTIDDVPQDEVALHENQTPGDKLGELPSTAICGNDITSSCFYVSGELLKVAGIYAPICTIFSSLTLFCFRSVYCEVVTALPLNGGIYNLLLNSSTKRTASVTACLTILSYTATGVVSAATAASYVECTPYLNSIERVPLALTILTMFAFLMLFGMQESSAVAASVFVMHLTVLTILSIFCLFYLQDTGLGQFYENLHWDQQPPVCKSIFFGFSAAMLGVSGFETSANFVEEQRPGVFAKTLRNMWAGVSSINFCLPCFMILIVPLDEVTGERSACSVTRLAEAVGGPTLRDIIGMDAVIVLAGAVLTSYVGVCGLFQRMAGDRCLPEFFATCNAWRGTPHNTIIFFFAITASMCCLFDGDISMLGNMYSLAFLLVMALFSICGLWMKVERATLPRQVHAPVSTFFLGLALVSIAFSAAVMSHTEVLAYFLAYYMLTVILVMVTFARVSIFTAFLRCLSSSFAVRMVVRCFVRMEVAEQWVVVQLQKLRSRGVIYFTKKANLSEINRALQYIDDNEEARWVRIVHVYTNDSQIPAKLLEYVQLLDCIYPKTRIDCVLVKGEFSPGTVQWISKRVSVPVNSMFINCPRHDFQHGLDTMGGVRVIQNSEKGNLLDDVKHLQGYVEVDSAAPASRRGRGEGVRWHHDL